MHAPQQDDLSPPDELNQAVRELIEVVRTADLDGTDLTGTIAQIRELRDDLRPRVVPGMRMQSALVYEMPATEDVSEGEPEKLAPPAAFRAEHPSDFFPYSPLVGLLNPISPPATMRRVAADEHFEIHGEVTFGAAFNGPPDCVHGGVIAALFDELLGSACVVNGIGGYTGTLTIVYRTPTPLGTPLQMRGWFDRSERRKVFAKGTLHAGDTLCAQAEGIFIQSENLRSPNR
ncbi:MAG: PaaI family thioesterase [Acidimicrobiaceae bacterium]|nr:PaaI family thioesterase [Acidimicrobiaceae bacterium]MXW75572.1 PaaI family thioesterase [Acidimicrobiaceae bacterium]MYD05846.1 PaaI family thioesterase [Acidimicrobiaceae bacterium]MYI59182.1 PaaI family thioesterase [Acidimicrobiaceae bacterium]